MSLPRIARNIFQWFYVIFSVFDSFSHEKKKKVWVKLISVYIPNRLLIKKLVGLLLSTILHDFFFIRKWASKTQKTLMLRKSPASNDWAGIYKKADFS